ncbi:MAG TPA: DoxX family protein [Pseudacidobacterium sp.]|jgi:putative oxidoreductase|nr:DoxX family protein [Pseudacidobacterium sp.]
MFAWLERFQPLGVLIARVILGAIMMVHGAHKIFPSGSLYSFTQTVGHLGLPAWLGYVSAFTEFFGGALLILGLLVPVAAAGMVINMTVAVLRVHLRHGLTGPMGFEFPLSLFALALLILFSGSGYLSVDGVLGISRRK